MGLLLVAEKDEDDRVAWVWYWRPGLRAARPLQDAREVANDLSVAEVHGASREQIATWIDRRLGREASR